MRLKQELFHESGISVREFTGSPLGLISEIMPFERVILIDSVVSSSMDPGRVVLFGKEELESYAKTFYVHGMNVSEVFSLAPRLGIQLPEDFLLIGISVKESLRFGESLDRELESGLDEIYRNVSGAIRDFLNHKTQ
jgi:hydrogenase maturation protease